MPSCCAGHGSLGELCNGSLHRICNGSLHRSALSAPCPHLQAVSLARSWLPASAAAGAAAAAPAGLAAALAARAAALGNWAGRVASVLWYAVVMTAGATVCKHITQTVEQHGCEAGARLAGARLACFLRDGGPTVPSAALPADQASLPDA